MLASFLVWLESTGFSVWMKESPSVFAFPMILAAHTIGLGLLAGIDIAHKLRVLGVAPHVPEAEFNRFAPFMWAGLWVNVASGVALLAGYPTKAMTNELFYVKLGFVAAAVALARIIRRPTRRAPRTLAVLSILCWVGAIAAGRLLAYTYHYLDVDDLLAGRRR
ncbi:MAG: hypothetical protein HYU37_05195 [Acidobacteria bacterium]|nr:hypothetical protein [Acidobacteriota bacterium]